MNRNEELIRNTLILALGTFVPKLMTLITLPILTGQLDTSSYGIYDLILSIANLAVPLITLQIQQAVFRHLLLARSGQDKDSYIASSVFFLVISSLITAPIVYFSTGFLGVSQEVRPLVCLLLIAESTYYLIGQILRGLGGNFHYSISVIVYSAVNLACIILFVLLLHKGLMGVVISLVIAYLCASVYGLCSMRIWRHIKLYSFSIESLKKLLNFSIPIIPSSISLWIVNMSNRLVITSFLGSSANGIYSVANKVPQLYSTFYNVFNLAWTETASRASDEGETQEYYSKMFDTLFRFLIGVMLLMIAVTPVMFRILIDENYYDAYSLVPILYMGVFFNSIVMYYAGIYIALKRTKQVGLSSAIGAAINLLCNLVLVKKYGLFASAVSTAVSYLAIALYRAYDINKVCKVRYNVKLLVVGMTFFVMEAILIYQGTTLMNLACLAIAVVYNCLFNYRLILAVLQKVKKRCLNR